MASPVRALRFEIAWDEHESRGDADEATRGGLRAFVGDSMVWGTAEAGFPWTWVELLEFLADAWLYIEFEETDPLGLAEAPDRLRVAAQSRWEGVPTHERKVEERQLWEFENTHNLARAIRGAWLPDLWLMRQGRSFLVSVGSRQWFPEASDVLASLEDVGNRIANRLKPLEDDRSVRAKQLWAARRERSVEEFVSVAVSLPRESVRQITGNSDLSSFWELGDAFEPNELLAAARLIGKDLQPEEIRRFFVVLRRVPRRETPELDRLSDAAELVIVARDAPHDQGYELARWFRRESKNIADKFDPEEPLRSWGIEVYERDLDVALDAVCVWGPRHGPVVFLNLAGMHAQSVAGRRATLAHEICHLLVDRRGALPLAEVLGGRTPLRVEKRARAFAAELLIPREIAGAELSRDVDPRQKIRELTTRFGVSREIVAWQAKNSGMSLHYRAADFLRREVTHPERY